MKLLSTEEAARAKGVSSRRIRALIEAGQLQAERVGKTYVIRESALASVKTYGKVGRPKKEAA